MLVWPRRWQSTLFILTRCPVSFSHAEGVAKGIEGFWLQALQNGRRTGPTIEEHDEPALKSLVDVTMEYLDDFQVRQIALRGSQAAWVRA
jgi:hypothetical protein